MTFITKFRRIFHTVVAGTATTILVASGSSAAQAAIFTYNYEGYVTELYGAGELLPPNSDLRGVEVGDRISGSYSYDDEVLSPFQPNSAVLTDFIYTIEASDGNTYVETLGNFLGVRANGIVNLDTADITVGINSPVPIYGAISSSEGSLFYSVRNTAIISTFELLVGSAPQSVPEYSSTLALLALTIAPIFLRSRRT
ncbi:hypothetical protein [Nostoc sp. MS1]|uniref:hypothetical protein n=1 Tax=Nostoc sp. MS1 TaxID=2764711 RepID=UPI001CC5E6C7|nr:hypothetical protein [Nostoc sp. MS1]BCL37622.1 hypothetical protein NSMS1_40690 [Nostoc sp. MS1]